MYYNGRKGVHTTVFLNEVHARVYQKYIIQQDQDIILAKKLQDFFQNLKNAAKDINSLSNNLDKELYKSLLNDITKNFSTKSNVSINALFRRLGPNSYERGDIFERELEAVIKAVAEKVSNSNIDFGDYEIRTGQKTGTTTLSDDILTKIQEEMAKGLTEEQAFKNIDYDLYKKRVQIKTDVQGINVEIAAEFKGTYLEEIQKILAQATFTAKSYASQAYNRQEDKIEMLNDLYPTIHLGKSDPFRAVYGALTSVGYNQSTATSAYAASSNLVSKNNQKVINHIYHLRYLYELTGAGTKLITGQYKEARFLIYNDPSTDNIYVKSSAEILKEVFEASPDWNGDPFGGIVISKSKFQ